LCGTISLKFVMFGTVVPPHPAPHTHTTLHTQFSLEKTHDGTATGASRFILRIPSVAHITSGAFKEPHKAIV
jgi:hypothetical protein